MSGRDLSAKPVVGIVRDRDSERGRVEQYCFISLTWASVFLWECVQTMTLSQFYCPHCRSPFQVETSLPSQQVACPHCRQPVALISEPPVVEPPLAAPPVMGPPLAEPPIAELPLRISTAYSPIDLLPPTAIVALAKVGPKHAAKRTDRHETTVDDFLSRQRVADERAARKFVKNMIVWVCCAIVLFSILAFFLMQGGS